MRFNSSQRRAQFMRSKECGRFYVVSPSSRLAPEDDILYNSILYLLGLTHYHL